MTLPEQIKRLRELESKATPKLQLLVESFDYHNSESWEPYWREFANEAVPEIRTLFETRNALPGILDALERREVEFKSFVGMNEQLLVCTRALAEAKEVLEKYRNGYHNGVPNWAEILLEKWGNK